MTAKKPHSGSNSTPKSAWKFTAQPSTCDAGLLAFLDALGLTEIAEDYLQEFVPAATSATTWSLCSASPSDSRLAGYDYQRLQNVFPKPAMRVVVGWQGSDRNAARTNTMSQVRRRRL